MARAHLRKQMYVLSDPSPTVHNDSDSEIASLPVAGWLRLGSHGTHWQQGRAAPGGLNLKPRFAKPLIMAGAGVLPAQRRTSDISQKAMCYLKPQFSRHISYDSTVRINAGGVVVRAALQYAWDSRFESESHECFCKMSHTHDTSIYAYIQNIQRSLAYIRSCTCSNAYIPRYTGFIDGYKVVYLLYTDLYWVHSLRTCIYSV